MSSAATRSVCISVGSPRQQSMHEKNAYDESRVKHGQAAGRYRGGGAGRRLRWTVSPASDNVVQALCSTPHPHTTSWIHASPVDDRTGHRIVAETHSRANRPRGPPRASVRQPSDHEGRGRTGRGRTEDGLAGGQRRAGGHARDGAPRPGGHRRAGLPPQRQRAGAPQGPHGQHRPGPGGPRGPVLRPAQPCRRGGGPSPRSAADQRFQRGGPGPRAGVGAGAVRAAGGRAGGHPGR